MSAAFAGLRDAGVPARRACALIGLSRATRYRHARGPVHGPALPGAVPGNGQALSGAERAAVLALISTEAYGTCRSGRSGPQARRLQLPVSASSMYRIARAAGQSRERRRQATHPAKVRPELLADGPSQVWTWDITKLRGPARGIFYQLYVLHRHLLPVQPVLDHLPRRGLRPGRLTSSPRPSTATAPPRTPSTPTAAPR